METEQTLFDLEMEEPGKPDEVRTIQMDSVLDSPPVVWQVEPMTAEQIEQLVLPMAQGGKK